MILSQLAEFVEIAVYGQPPKKLLETCGDYYQPYYHLFYLLGKATRTGCAVELGVDKGRGVNSLALGNRHLKVIGLDLNVAPKKTLSNVDFHLMSALPVPEFIEDIAILHIDTEHNYDNALNEFMQYKSKLLPGAVVCFDDLHAADDGVLRAFYELPYPKIQDDRLHPGNGYGVLIFDGTK